MANEFVLFDIEFLCICRQKWNDVSKMTCPTTLWIDHHRNGRNFKAKYLRVCLCGSRGHFHSKAYHGHLQLMYDQSSFLFNRL